MASVPSKSDCLLNEHSNTLKRDQKRISCMVPNCSSKSAQLSIKFYMLPRDLARRETWLKSMGLRVQDLKNVHNFVCQKHFSPEYIGYSRLTRNAIPCKNLPSKLKHFLNDSKITSEASHHSTETTNSIEMSDEEEFGPAESNMDDDCESSIIDPTKTIVAENLECSSTDSFSYGNDQNIFAANFTYKNPVFLQKRIDKYKKDLKKIMEEQEAIEIKRLIQQATNKEIYLKSRNSKKIKEMADFHEIYDKPQMKIPKLIFERFMVDYENEECPEDLKRFAAEVYSRSADAYDYMRQCFTNVLPPVNDFQEFLKDTKSDNLSDEN